MKRAGKPAPLKISTHTPLARRDDVYSWKNPRLKISTHTPLARRDRAYHSYRLHKTNFYSHASCEA